MLDLQTVIINPDVKTSRPQISMNNWTERSSVPAKLIILHAIN